MSKEDVEEILREFDELYFDSNLGWVSLHDTDPEDVKNFIREKLTPLVAQKADRPFDILPAEGLSSDATPQRFGIDYGYTVAQKEQKDHCTECWKRIAQSGDIPIYGCANAACKNCHIQLVKEQKEGVELSETCRKAVETPTPTVKEESHTQGWEERFQKMYYAFDKNGLSDDSVENLKAFIKEVASQEYERGKCLYNGGSACLQTQDGHFYFHGKWVDKEKKEAFEAGRLQGIADVEKWAFENGLTHKECFKLLLTALSSLTHKE